MSMLRAKSLAAVDELSDSTSGPVDLKLVGNCMAHRRQYLQTVLTEIIQS